PTSYVSLHHTLYGCLLRIARTRSVSSCPGAALIRTVRAVPSSLGGTALRRHGAEIPIQHRQRIVPRSFHLSPDGAASAEPIDRRHNAGKRSQATVMPPNLAEFPAPSSTIALLPILQLSTTFR